MIEYYPWSKDNNNKILNNYKNGIYSILEIELSGSCNLSCSYCDTPNRNNITKLDYDLIEEILKKNNIEWLFICGLGEPFARDNYHKMLRILKICKENQTKISIFTNGLNLTDEILEYVDYKILYLIIKLDTFNIDLEKKIYGKSIYSKKIFQKILKYISLDKNNTNIAASIVPTRYNIMEIKGIFNWCLENNIYPLIGDLEDAGSAKNIFDTLSVSQLDKLNLKNDIDKLYDRIYQLPICPSVLNGIKINFENYAVVDSITGLSCSWFWLNEPKLKKLYKIKNNQDYIEITKLVSNYRNDKLDEVKKILPTIEDSIFGGCGGDIKQLLELLLEFHPLHMRSLTNTRRENV